MSGSEKWDPPPGAPLTQAEDTGSAELELATLHGRLVMGVPLPAEDMPRTASEDTIRGGTRALIRVPPSCYRDGASGFYHLNRVKRRFGRRQCRNGSQSLVNKIVQN